VTIVSSQFASVHAAHRSPTADTVRRGLLKALSQVPAIEWLAAFSSVAGPIGGAYALRFIIRRRAFARLARQRVPTGQ